MKTYICAKGLSSSTSIQYENMPLYKISILNSISVQHKPNIYVKLSSSSKSGQHETDVWITLSSSSISIQYTTCVYTKWFSSSTSIQYQTCVYIQWPSSSAPTQNMHPSTKGSPLLFFRHQYSEKICVIVHKQHLHLYQSNMNELGYTKGVSSLTLKQHQSGGIR